MNTFTPGCNIKYVSAKLQQRINIYWVTVAFILNQVKFWFCFLIITSMKYHITRWYMFKITILKTIVQNCSNKTIIQKKTINSFLTCR